MASQNQLWSDDAWLHPGDFPLYDEDDQSFHLQDDLIDELESLLSGNSLPQTQTLKAEASPDKTQLPSLECKVCGAPAHGYNFDQITCESCKAFFRRNAFRDMSQLQCQYNGDCSINIHTRRQCTYCRLKKCFDVKMRKDWIRTEEEKQLRQMIKLEKEKRKLNNKRIHVRQLAVVQTSARRKHRSSTKPTDQTLVSSSSNCDS